MNINLHIERLILDGVPLAANQRPALQAAVEAKLARLLETDGLQSGLSGGAFYRVPAAGIEVTHDTRPAQMGEQIAGAIYGGVKNE